MKLGQLLSSRPDLLPDVYVDELAKLVDDAQPVPFEQVARTIDEERVAMTKRAVGRPQRQSRYGLKEHGKRCLGRALAGAPERSHDEAGV